MRDWKVGDRFNVEGVITGEPDEDGDFLVEFHPRYGRYFNRDEMEHAIPINPDKKAKLRDKFAMAALTGLLALGSREWEIDEREVAKAAYILADAMLKARKV